jgi:hypothetical protein
LALGYCALPRAPHAGGADTPKPCAGSNSESSAGAAIDTEHIFGFAEGADIGEKGERELEITATSLIGKLGLYVGIQNETAFRYGVAEGFRASIGGLTDYRAISGVPDLADLHALNIFAGVSSEFRWQFLNRFSSPLDLTVSFEPQWQNIDNTSGHYMQSYVLPLRLLADIPLIPEKMFAAFNLSYVPTFARIGGIWQRQNPVENTLAASTAITGNSFLGLEVRQSTLNQHGFGPCCFSWAKFVFEAVRRHDRKGRRGSAGPRGDGRPR